MSLLSIFLEANLALMVTMAVIASLRLLVVMIAGPVAPRSDVILMRAILVMATLTPFAVWAFEAFSGMNAVLIALTTQFDTLWGSAIQWMSEAQSPSIFWPLLILGSILVGLVAFVRDIRGLARLKAISPIIRHLGRVELREGPPDLQPCAFLEKDHMTILLPKGTSQRERRAILFHEASHMRHHDLQWNWIFALASCLYAINPAFRLLRAIHQHQCEVACDWRVVTRRPIALTDYAKSLVTVAAAASRAAHPASGLKFLGASYLQKTGLKWRIHSLMHNGKAQNQRSFLPALLALALVTNLAMATLRIDVQTWSITALSQATYTNLQRMPINKHKRAFGLVLAY